MPKYWYFEEKLFSVTDMVMSNEPKRDTQNIFKLSKILKAFIG